MVKKDEILDFLLKKIREHMEKQPYSIVCDNCGERLEVVRKLVDADLDLTLRVKRCGCDRG